MEAIFKTIGNYSPAEIRELVRDKYSEVALNPSLKYKFRVGREYALDLGYPAHRVHALPEKMAEAFTGVSSFMARFEDFTSGGVVLELGSGGGFDTALLAERFGAATKVIGVDLSLDMIRRAMRSLGELELSQVNYTQAVAEELPVRDNAVDWVVSNGIFNLSPEKERILSEIHRVLKPEGHVLCSEIVLYQEPSPEDRLNEDDWFK
jgi:arsenite methyltransferase